MDKCIYSLLNELSKRLMGIEKMIMNQKTVLTLEEAARYAGISKSTLYKLTSLAKVEHSKPNNKMIYFDRKKFEEYLLSNRVKDEKTIVREASSYCINKKQED